ncbi:MAG TPA: oligosaccharide flippase family protein [Thermoleophilaceae bacterium]|nr:oligosaccharide flippase family protein [Thermoleophilaceae bacterium]
MKRGSLPGRGSLSRMRESETGKLFGDSAYAAVWQAAISVADLVQIVLITHALGLDDYGRLALAIGFVVLVGQLFDLRVGVATTIAGAAHLHRDNERAAGVFQLGYGVDAVTGLLGFAVVAALAPFVGPALIGDGGTVLIILYALVLLAQTVDESSFTVLRLLDRFRLIATYTVVLEAGRVALVAGALAVYGTITSVAVALVAHRVLAGAAAAAAAAGVFRRVTGVRLTSLALAKAREDRPQLLRTMLHTNVVSYARLAQTQLPTVLVGALAGATQAGVYKVGMAAAVMVGRIIDPAYAALLPRLSRLWSAGRRGEIRRLVRRLSTVAIPAVMALAGALILLRTPVLDALGGAQASADAGPVLIFGTLAHALNASLLWNVPALYAAGRANLVSRLAMAAAAAQLLALFPLVDAYEASGAALSLLISMLVLNLGATIYALGALRDAPSIPVAPAAGATR